MQIFLIELACKVVENDQDPTLKIAIIGIVLRFAKKLTVLMLLFFPKAKWSPIVYQNAKVLIHVVRFSMIGQLISQTFLFIGSICQAIAVMKKTYYYEQESMASQTFKPA